MNPAGPVIVFVHVRWFPYMFLATGTVFAVLGMRAWNSGSSHGIAVACGLTGLLGLAAFIEARRTRLELRGDTLVLHRWGRTRTIPRTSIERIAWEKGQPVRIVIRDQQQGEKVPSVVGAKSLALAHTLQAWLDKKE